MSWLSRVVRPVRRRKAELPPYFDRLYLLRSVERTLMEESERMPGVETGGVLVGFVDSRLNAVVVTAASGPGPRAHHGTCTFNRDRAFCQQFLDQHAAATGGIIDFVGEWHKHREPDPQPSPVDQNTYRQLAVNRDAKVTRPVVLIAGSKAISRRPVRDQYIRVNGFIFRSDSFVAREVRWLADEAYTDLVEAGNGRVGPRPTSTHL